MNTDSTPPVIVSIVPGLAGAVVAVNMEDGQMDPIFQADHKRLTELGAVGISRWLRTLRGLGCAVALLRVPPEEWPAARKRWEVWRVALMEHGFEILSVRASVKGAEQALVGRAMELGAETADPRVALCWCLLADHFNKQQIREVV